MNGSDARAAQPLLTPPAPPPQARPVLIVWIFVGIVAWLLALAIYSAHILAASRSLVAAESAWSKAQKDAVFHLARYADSGQAADFAAYERAMAVIEAARRARDALAADDPDMDEVRAGLTAAGVHPSEVDGLIALWRQVSGLEPTSYAGALWRASDAPLDQLRALASRLRAGEPVPGAAERIGAINAVVAPLERDFAATVARAQRTAQSLLAGGIMVVTAILLVGAIVISRRFLAQNERLQRSLSQSETQLRRLVEAAPLPLVIARAADQRVLYANERALEQFSLEMDAALTRSLADFQVEPGEGSALAGALSRRGAVRDQEVHLKDAHGREFWVLLSAQPIRYAGAVCLLVAMANIDERKRLQDDMRRKAMHDPLTGLPNRAMFMEALERAVARARRRASRFSVLFVDLDRFKEVNDRMGHHAGDVLLQTLARRLAGAVRQSDLVARLAGDEFVVLIEEHGGPEEVMIVAQKALLALQSPVAIDWREASVSGSIGIASFPEDGGEVSTLVRNADTAMYQAKERGRNNFQFYSEELNALSHRRFEQEKRVRAALERDEFFLQYQPELDTATGRCVAVEALLRWRDPEGHVVMPAAFLPLAEESGVAAEISDWVLDRALRDLRGWRDAGLDVKVAVNVSARQLQSPGLAEAVGGALARHGVEPRRLRLEVTEPTLMIDSDAASRAVRALKALGLEMAIDNFGTGYSSLGLVRGLPIEVVKIDKSLVSHCTSKRECAAIVQAACAMSRVLGIRVVAEGVETEEQREAMRALGCDGMQGYLLAPPVDAAGIAAMTRAAAAQTFLA